MPIDPDLRAAPDAVECVSFLASLASRAPDMLLLDRWKSLGALQGTSLPPLANRFGMSSALFEFVARAAADSPHARRFAASALATSVSGSAAMSLLQRLMDDPAARETAPVVIKGAALRILGLAGDERAFVDVDLVVEPGRIDPWRQAAACAGAAWERGGGYEAAHVVSGSGMIEIHSSLPGFYGNEAGPPAAELERVRVATSWPGLFALGGQPAREVCVQHFVFHHDGEAQHALRVLQDLAALEGQGEGPGLDWGNRTSDVRRATANLRALARSFREGEESDDQARFVEALASVAAIEEPIDGFSREIDRWISGRTDSGGSRAALVLRRLFPPIAEMRRTPGESAPITLMRYVWRPLSLVYRYLRDRIASRRTPARQRRIDEWQRLLRG